MKEKTYRVIGERRVFGRVKGETFSLAISPAHEAALIEGGHVQVEAASKGADASTTTKQKEEEHG